MPEKYKSWQAVNTKIGTPHILFNNAGSGQWLHMEEETFATLESTIACPYLAAAYVTRVFIDNFIKRRSGHIVNVTSAAAFSGFRGLLVIRLLAGL